MVGQVPRKSKYPFYRPHYNTTKPIFGPFIDFYDKNREFITKECDEWSNNDYQTLFQYISSNSVDFISYHNYSQTMTEINYLTKLYQYPPFNCHFSIVSEAKSSLDRNLHKVTIQQNSKKSETSRNFQNSQNSPKNSQNSMRNKKNKLSKNQKIRMLLICGEHPRELIVIESCFDFIYNLTVASILIPSANTNNNNNNNNIPSILDQTYFTKIVSTFKIDIIPILNPDGKVILESNIKNQYCWRWDGNRVDLNRNFDWEFGGQGSTHKKGTEEWHGEKVFSETESQYIDNLLTDRESIQDSHRFTIVLDIHSGTQQLFIPFVDSKSWKTHRTRGDITIEETKLVEYIQDHSNGYYKNSGIGWKFNDYGADGTIMDYIGGRMNISYSICAEIYGDPNVDMSIDCFVQFNPNNGKDFKDSLRKIFTLYQATFEYFWDETNGIENEIKINAMMKRNANALHQYLKS